MNINWPWVCLSGIFGAYGLGICFALMMNTKSTLVKVLCILMFGLGMVTVVTAIAIAITHIHEHRSN